MGEKFVKYNNTLPKTDKSISIPKKEKSLRRHILFETFFLIFFIFFCFFTTNIVVTFLIPLSMVSFHYCELLRCKLFFSTIFLGGENLWEALVDSTKAIKRRGKRVGKPQKT